MENQYYLQIPRKQLFYRIMASVLTLVGIGNQTMWGYDEPHILFKFNNFIVTTFAPFCIITQFAYLFIYRKELTFDTIGIIFSIIPVSCLAYVNLLSSQLSSYKSLMNDFMKNIHLFTKNKNHDKFVETRLLIVERLTRWTAFYLIFFYTLNWVAWIFIPIYNNFKNKEQIYNKTMRLQTCIYMWMPFDYNYNYRNWAVTHFFNVYVVGSGVIIMMLFHTLNYIFIYHLIGHIQVLKYKIQNYFHKDLSDVETKSKLVEIIEYHAFIIRVFDSVQAAFGINISANYLHNLIGDSLILYQMMYGNCEETLLLSASFRVYYGEFFDELFNLSNFLFVFLNNFSREGNTLVTPMELYQHQGKENIMLYVVMVVVYMGELILMSFVLEQIRREADDLPDILYSIPWEHMSISNQKSLILVLQRLQPAMEFKALGGFKAGVRPMISILKTTFSYYVMLKSSMGEQ